MVLLPSTATLNLNTNTSNPADLFTRPLPTHRRFKARIPLPTLATPVASHGVATSVVSTSVASTYLVVSATLVQAPLARTIPDPGLARPPTPFQSDYGTTPTSNLVLPLNKKPYGIATSASDQLLPYTLITGEDPTVIASDLSSTDSTDSKFPFDFASAFQPSSHRFETKYFGTVILIFVYSNSDLIKLFVEPDYHFEHWFYWTLIPRLTLRDSYFQVVPGTTLDYTQVFALLHLIPIWFVLVYSLLH